MSGRHYGRTSRGHGSPGGPAGAPRFRLLIRRMVDARASGESVPHGGALLVGHEARRTAPACSRPSAPAGARPRLAALTAVVLAGGIAWAVTGPARVGWSAMASLMLSETGTVIEMSSSYHSAVMGTSYAGDGVMSRVERLEGRMGGRRHGRHHGTPSRARPHGWSSDTPRPCHTGPSGKRRHQDQASA
jgi:hypothetical protein